MKGNYGHEGEGYLTKNSRGSGSKRNKRFLSNASESPGEDISVNEYAPSTEDVTEVQRVKDLAEQEYKTIQSIANEINNAELLMVADLLTEATISWEEVNKVIEEINTIILNGDSDDGEFKNKLELLRKSKGNLESKRQEIIVTLTENAVTDSGFGIDDPEEAARILNAHFSAKVSQSPDSGINIEYNTPGDIIDRNKMSEKQNHEAVTGSTILESNSENFDSLKNKIVEFREEATKRFDDFNRVYKELSKKTQKRQSVAYDKIISIYNDILKTSNISNEDNLEKSLEKLSEVYINFINSCQTLLDEIKKDGVSKVVLPVDVASPAPDKVTKVSVLESGADDNSALPENDLDSRQELDRNYVVQLTEMYKKRDNRVFKVPPGHDGSPFKKIDEVWDELGFILRHEGFTQEQINEFLNNSIARDIRTDISSVNKAFHDNRGDKLDLKNERSAYYERLLAEVANFLVAKSVEGTHTSTEDKAMVEPKEQQESGTLSVSELTELYRGGQWSVFETINSDGTPVYKGIDRIFDEVKLVVEEQDIDRVEKEEILRKVGDIVNEVKRLTSESVLEDDENKREKLSAGVQEELNKLFNLVQNSLQRDNSQDLPNTTTIPTIGKVNIDNKVFVKPHSFENYSVPALGGDEVFDGVGGVEIYESGILNDGPNFYEQLDGLTETNDYESLPDTESRKQTLAENFERWKNGDPVSLPEGWSIQLDTVRQSISTTLYLAGYNKTERQEIYRKDLNPWILRIIKLRRQERKKKGTTSEALAEERQRMLDRMKELLEGRELDPVLLENENSQVNESPKTLTEVNEKVDFFKKDFLLIRDKLKVEALSSSDQEVISRIENLFKELEGNVDNDIGVALIKKNNHLKVLSKDIAKLRELVKVTINSNHNQNNLDIDLNNPNIGIDTADNTPASNEAEYWNQRKEAASKTKEAKTQMEALQEENNLALSEYYKSRKVGRKILDIVRKFAGKEDSLPEEIKASLQAFDDASEEYKRLLEEQLDLRSSRTIGSTKFTADSDFVQSAFDKKLVGDTYTEQQKSINLAKFEQRTENEKTRLGRMMSVVRENKKTFRYLGLGLAATIGFVATGGLAGVGLGASRWAVATFGGAAAAGHVFEKGAKQVNKASTNLDLLLQGSTPLAESLSVAEKRQLIKQASVKVDQAKLRQIAKAGVAAFAVGGASRGIFALEDVLSSVEPVGVTNASTNTIPQGGSNPVGGPVTEAVERPGVTAQAGVTDTENPNVTVTPPAESATNATEVIPELKPFKLVDSVGVLSDDISGNIFKNVVSGIELQGNNQLNLSPDKLAEIQKFTRLKVDDILADHINMPTAKVEELLTQKLQLKYGLEDWWKSADIQGVKIGRMEIVDVNTPLATEAVVPPDNDVMSSGNDPINDNKVDEMAERTLKLTHTVKSGDNVSTIFHKNLLDQFDQKNLKLPEGVTRGELSKMMYSKFPELTDAKNPNWTLSPQEWKDLGVGSGNPALIRPGENIDVAKLLEKFADPEVKPGQSGVKMSTDIPVRPRTGALPITADSGERVVPINYAPVRPDEFGIPNVNDIPPTTYYDTPVGYDGEELPKAEVSPVTEPQYPPVTPEAQPMKVSYTERHEVPLTVESDAYSSKVYGSFTDTKVTYQPEAAYNGPQAPRVMSPVDGQYFRSPEFSGYLKANGLTTEMMEKVVEKTVSDFEASTYTKWEIITGAYKSPYDELSSIPMKELLLMHMKADGNEQELMGMLQDKVSNANFKPETLKVWVKVVDGIVTNNKVPFGETTTFADVFERHMSQTIVEHKFKTGATGLESVGKKSLFDLFKDNLDNGAKKNFIRNSVRVDGVLQK